MTLVEQLAELVAPSSHGKLSARRQRNEDHRRTRLEKAGVGSRRPSSVRPARQRPTSIQQEQVKPESPPTVMTIGHSTRTLDEFIRLLHAHAITRVVDVRTVPRSRHNPQFNRDTLPASLKVAGIGYVHMLGLGGLRHAAKHSLNTGWRNASFRGYADYMQTPAFEQSLNELIQLANQDRVALMCAEAVPWRCHRSLIADALLVRGIRTEHIMGLTRHPSHTLTSFARAEGTHIFYDG